MLTKEFVRDITVMLLRRAAVSLPSDVRAALVWAYNEENDKIARLQLENIIRNFNVARQKLRPLCQDTGLPTVYVSVGRGFYEAAGGDVFWTLRDGILEGVSVATDEIPLRANAVEPLTRLSRNGNVGEGVPCLEFELTDGSCVELAVLLRGGGAENASAFRMLTPADAETTSHRIKEFVLETVLNAGGKPCPPVVVGVGIGGCGVADAFKLARRVLLRRIGERNEDETLAKLEEELLAEINETGIGPMGLGGRTTALDVHVKTADCHVASLPVAVSLSCWALRRTFARIHADGRLEYF
ncbi:MAG: fumarate hydratase [Candidatus Alkanophagales archaeon]|nr:MAG: fumarate hydratase [Candidatus Alkanophagales archaeon]